MPRKKPNCLEYSQFGFSAYFFHFLGKNMEYLKKISGFQKPNIKFLKYFCRSFCLRP